MWMTHGIVFLAVCFLVNSHKGGDWCSWSKWTECSESCTTSDFGVSCVRLRFRTRVCKSGICHGEYADHQPCTNSEAECNETSRLPDEADTDTTTTTTAAPTTTTQTSGRASRKRGPPKRMPPKATLPTTAQPALTTVASLTPPTTTAVPTREELCSSPLVVGKCRAAYPRWYFNETEGKCIRFRYGGCGGNLNNHKSPIVCRRKCIEDGEVVNSTMTAATTPSPTTTAVPSIPNTTPMAVTTTVAPTQEEMCVAPMVVGPCRAAHPRWYYDPSIGECVSFRYGGCGGNFNNHRSPVECRRKCVKDGELVNSTMTATTASPTTTTVPSTTVSTISNIPRNPPPRPKMTTPPRKDPPSRTQTKNSSTRTRVPTKISGRTPPTSPKMPPPQQAKSTNPPSTRLPTTETVSESVTLPNTTPMPVTTTAAPTKEEMCVAPMVVGPCRAAHPRWYYDPSIGECVSFRYGGCGGNFNNHKSPIECEKKCMDETKEAAPSSRAALKSRPPSKNRPTKRPVTMPTTTLPPTTEKFISTVPPTPTTKTAEPTTTVIPMMSDECESTECNDCQVCRLSSRNQTVCVPDPSCCPNGVPPNDCAVDPCVVNKGACNVTGAQCIASFCNGCHAYFYDQDWKEPICIPEKKKPISKTT